VGLTFPGREFSWPPRHSLPAPHHSRLRRVILCLRRIVLGCAASFFACAASFSAAPRHSLPAPHHPSAAPRHSLPAPRHFFAAPLYLSASPGEKRFLPLSFLSKRHLKMRSSPVSNIKYKKKTLKEFKHRIRGRAPGAGRGQAEMPVSFPSKTGCIFL
jgi:hypothetical protein